MTSRLSQISGWVAIVMLFAAGAVTTFMFGKQLPVPAPKVLPALSVAAASPSVPWLPPINLPDVSKWLASLAPATLVSLLTVAAGAGILIAVVALAGGLAILFVILDRQLKGTSSDSKS